MFADDILMMAIHVAYLEHLKNILENLTSDFRMKISIKKTQVITPDSEFLTRILERRRRLRQYLSEYRCLGIDQGQDERETSMNKSCSLVVKSES